MDLFGRHATTSSIMSTATVLKCVVFVLILIVVPWSREERCLAEAVRTKGDAGRRSGAGAGARDGLGAGAGARGELVRDEAPVELPSGQQPDFAERVSSPERPTACAQNLQPTQFLPSWLPVNNIHVGGSPQQLNNCTALEELVSMVTKQTELSQRVLSELENLPRKHRISENYSASTKVLPRDCAEALASGSSDDGRYILYPQDNGDPFYAYCDMHTDGGGWTVIQNREDGSVSFFRDWNDYKHGFGNINSEHWLGNEKIHRLSAQTYYVLRVELEDFEGTRKFATYDYFRLGDEGTKYRLLIGTYDGDAGDSLGYHGSKPFVTRDRDSEQECAVNSKGAWWYDSCFESNLNGVYKGRPRPAGVENILWSAWRGYSVTLKKTQMKIRPVK